MFVASWNAKRLTETDTDKIELKLTKNGIYGYYINEKDSETIAQTDTLYVWNTSSGATIWLASPSGAESGTGYSNICVITGGTLYKYTHYNGTSEGVRPVVCLKSSIPATVGTGDYDFSLTK